MIDSLDERLIALLEKNASQASRLLAKELGVDSSTVRRRVKKLIEEGVIHIAAIPDPDKIGSHFVAIVAFDIAPENVEAVLDFLASQPQVRWLSATAGRFDAMAIVWFPSSNDYYHFIQQKLAQLEGIRNIEAFICLHQKKRAALPIDQ